MPQRTRRRRVNEAFLQAASRASFRLLEVIALALGLPHDALHHLFMPSHSSRLRLNYYPVMPHAPPDALGISPHKDSGFLTVHTRGRDACSVHADCACDEQGATNTTHATS